MTKSPATKHVLLIDDDPVTNMINKKIITKNFNVTVRDYTNALEVLDQLNLWISKLPEQLPEFIFLDINMPVIDGWQFLTEFEKLPAYVQEKCKIFILTSSIDLEDIEKSRSHKSVREFISKPLTPGKLKQLID